jgi:hypothetical protein
MNRSLGKNLNFSLMIQLSLGWSLIGCAFQTLYLPQIEIENLGDILMVLNLFGIGAFAIGAVLLTNVLLNLYFLKSNNLLSNKRLDVIGGLFLVAINFIVINLLYFIILMFSIHQYSNDIDFKRAHLMNRLFDGWQLVEQKNPENYSNKEELTVNNFKPTDSLFSNQETDETNNSLEIKNNNILPKDILKKELNDNDLNSYDEPIYKYTFIEYDVDCRAANNMYSEFFRSRATMITLYLEKSMVNKLYKNNCIDLHDYVKNLTNIESFGLKTERVTRHVPWLKNLIQTSNMGEKIKINETERCIIETANNIENPRIFFDFCNLAKK